MQNELKCCVVSCERPLDQDYWDAQYQAGTTGWDIGTVSPAIQRYVEGLTDKNMRILIPGSGNSYEAVFLARLGFQQITVIDIAPTVTKTLKESFHQFPQINVITGDFFDHQGQYDLILEQTFFCALPPTMRQRYVYKMWHLLAENGILAGLLFDREFESGPPFGGSMKEYEALFFPAFVPKKWAPSEDSVTERKDSEIFMELRKETQFSVSLFRINGITCSGCMDSVCDGVNKLPGVEGVSMSTDFRELLVVSEEPVDASLLKSVIESKYDIESISS